MDGADVEIETDEGPMTTFVVGPDDDGPHPVVVFLMDAPGKRPLLHDMARRLAGHGYRVLLPNLYHRVTDAFELDPTDEASFARMTELMRGVGNAMAGRDVGAVLAWADDDPLADASRVGLVGYCMSGPFAVWSAAEHADRVRAAASFYGVRLHTDRHYSPHRRLGEITGELYVGAAEHDDWISLDEVDRFEAGLQRTEVAGRVERYWGCHHGFAFADRPVHDEAADRRHVAALLDLFERNLAS